MTDLRMKQLPFHERVYYVKLDDWRVAFTARLRFEHSRRPAVPPPSKRQKRAL